MCTNLQYILISLNWRSVRAHARRTYSRQCSLGYPERFVTRGVSVVSLCNAHANRDTGCSLSARTLVDHGELS